MENKFDELISTLLISPLSSDILNQITLALQEQINALSSLFISQSIQSLLILEQWTWELLSKESHSWIEQTSYSNLLDKITLFNHTLIFNTNDIEADIKSSLLVPKTTKVIDEIFHKIEHVQDPNDPYLILISCWFDNLSYFVHEYTQFIGLPSIIHLCQHIGQHYILSDQYKSYLTQLCQSKISQTIFTARQLFYIKTCSFLFRMYVCSKLDKSPFHGDDLLKRYGQDYIQIILIHSHTVQLWSREFLTCITHLNDFLCACCWWGNDDATYIEEFVPSEQIFYEYIQGLICIISEKSIHESILSQWSNDETILIDSTLIFLLGALKQIKDLSCFIRSETMLSNVILVIAQKSCYDRVSLCAYGILAEILSDEQLKELKVTSNISEFFFRILEYAWKHPTQRCKRIPIPQLLLGFLTLSKNDAIQQKTADSNKISLFIEMCGQYPIAFKIIWALSFNQDIQQQLRSNRTFMSKLNVLKEECNNSKMRNIIFGILWNLELKYIDRSISETTMFDIMISYSHKDEVLCKQIYEELVKAGFRVWIDFDQMHGNVMDAMAQAIERSNTIVICMSEQYRRSNYCRAEAHYAFQRQLKIVPVLLQEHYEPDGWLLFLIGQLLYVDFTKHEFPRAIELLIQELEAPAIQLPEVVSVPPTTQDQNYNNVSSSCLSRLPENIIDWKQTDVQSWLVGSNLRQMARLLFDFDGPSLNSLRELIAQCDLQQMLNLLQDDSQRRIRENISLLEVARFRTLLSERKQLNEVEQRPKNNDYKYNVFNYCEIM
ncbi:hypothetical protein I4U23_025686 [Adineta vaga]|nr:hypothetical protein I4U23_025686 [Adineta vaga]